ncbi:MAG: hypothetical protein A3E87_07490 [Gammaproteobacteria bacterium RIFCSPHIGHO2_12_FULL_35_23]|nr:MAG: hypothetical protein A3E87_07490 [Gammaproteobacteria bacterium RIFCSPHIGHO2_12_FULL_35_23]
MKHSGKIYFSLFNFAVVCLIAPFLISTFVHFDYITNYSVGSFSLSTFQATYYTGVYKYRILGRELFLNFYYFIHWLSLHGIMLHHISSFTLQRLGNNTEAVYYLAQYFNDTLFLCLAAMALFYLFSRRYYSLDNSQRNLSIMIIIFFIASSEYVLNVYDGLYYLISIFALLFIFEDLYNQRQYAFLGVCLMLILGALTIEHSVLILAIYAAIYLDRYGLKIKKPLLKLAILFILFFIVYFLLRIIYGFNHGVYDVLALTQVNLRFLYLTGMSLLFLFCGSFIAVGNFIQFKRVFIFIVFSIPYILSIFSFAYLAEVRVWIPVIIPAICIALLKPKSN